jgi:hypothetical protein
MINLTPHEIKMNNGAIYQPSGTIARVSSAFANNNEFMDGSPIFNVEFGEVIGLPGQCDGYAYIVSAMVLSALGGSRSDVFAPATGHPDCKRNESGQIVSVPGFVR